MTRRVVITGLGALSPVGNNVEDTWANLLAGKSGIAEITLFDTTDLAVKIGGEVKGFVAEDWIDPEEARHMDRSVQFAVVAAGQALKDSGIDMAERGSRPSGDHIWIGCGGRRHACGPANDIHGTRPQAGVAPFPPQLSGRFGVGTGGNRV